MSEIYAAWEWLNKNPILLGIFLLVAALICAFLVDLLFAKALKGLARVTRSKVDDEILHQLHGPVRASVLLGTAVLALSIFLEEHPWQNTLINIVYSALALMWTWFLIRVSRTLFRSLKQKHRGDPRSAQLYPLLDNLLMVVLIVLGGYWMFRVWHINVTPLLASAGIVTAAVALASKDTLANLFGGVSVLVDRPYKLGDWVEMDGKLRGQVVDIGIRSTRLLTRDDVLITIPNSIMSTSTIINESGKVPRFRVRVTVGVGFESDLALVEKVLVDACEGINEIVPSPKARARFREIGESTLNYQLLAWIHNPADRGRIIHQLNTNIVNGCRAAGIDLAFPQRVLSFRPGPESQARVLMEKEREALPEPEQELPIDPDSRTP